MMLLTTNRDTVVVDTNDNMAMYGAMIKYVAQWRVLHPHTTPVFTWRPIRNTTTQGATHVCIPPTHHAH